MCHMIEHRDNDRFLYNGNFLIGNKRLRIINNKIVACSFDEPYQTTKGNYGIICHGNINKQEIGFRIPSLSYPKLGGFDTWNKSSIINAGCHVSAFFQVLALNKEIIPKHLTINQSRSIIYAQIPVMFTIDSIVFYDGQDVSVSRFIIPKPKELDKIFNIINKIQGIRYATEFNEKEFKRQYKEIYEKIGGK